jgi:large subunit ribosomal protein L15
MPINLSDLKPNEGARTNSKRVGRGIGSGKGKTSGRGHKGQKARSGKPVRPGFEGGQLPIQRRMPYKRGFTNIFRTPWEIVNLETLERITVSGPVTPDALHAAGVIRGADYPLKVLAKGELSKAVEVHAHAFSEAAKAQIEAAGGTVTILERTDRWVTASPRSRRPPMSREQKAARLGNIAMRRSRDEN